MLLYNVIDVIIRMGNALGTEPDISSPETKLLVLRMDVEHDFSF